MILKPDRVALLPTTGDAMNLRPWIKHFLGRRVLLAYDSDAAGRKAAPRRPKELLLAACEVWIAYFFPAKDGAA